jgi:hypothetical protein
MLFVAMDYYVGSLVMVVQGAVGQDTGELEDAVLDGVQATHLEVHPKELRYELVSHIGIII